MRILLKALLQTSVEVPAVVIILLFLLSVGDLYFAYRALNEEGQPRPERNNHVRVDGTLLTREEYRGYRLAQRHQQNRNRIIRIEVLNQH